MHSLFSWRLLVILFYLPFLVFSNNEIVHESIFFAPSCTNLSLPQNGALGVPIDSNLEWNLIIDADGYLISVGTSPSGNDILNNVDVGNANIFDLASNLPENTQIFVLITPYNSSGAAIGCSQESFTTENLGGEPLSLTVGHFDVTCTGSNDGGMQAEAMGGTEPYLYELLDGTGTNVLIPQQSNSLFESLGAGDYIVRVYDNAGNTVDVQAVINEPLPIAVTANVTYNSCPSSNDSEIEVSASGGLPPYQYSLSGIPYSTSNTFNNLTPGVYTVFARDFNGCQQSTTITVETITNCPKSIQFSSDMTVNEDEGMVIFEVTLDNTIIGGFTVDYATVSATAEEPIDFIATNGTLTFAGTIGETQVISVPIFDDNFIEANEEFIVQLSNVSSSEVTINDNLAVGTIVDNDFTTGVSGISFDTTIKTVSENSGTAAIKVVLNGSLEENLTIDFTTFDGAATTANDYTLTSGSLDFQGFDGEEKLILIPIIDDNDAEGNEDFGINLSNISTNLIPINTEIANITILDNEQGQSPEIGFVLNSLTVDESVGTLEIDVILNGEVPGGFHYNYASSQGSAVFIDDYDYPDVSNGFFGGLLHFDGYDGEVQQIRVAIVDDAITESTEDIVIRLLSGSVPGIQKNGDSITVDIMDNDSQVSPSVRLTETQYEVNEDVGTITFTVELDGSFDGGFNVEYHVDPSTADLNSDFIASSGVLEFDGVDGEVKHFSVQIIDDTIIEEEEDFFAYLYATSTASVSIAPGGSDASIQVVDNDIIAGVSGIWLDNTSISINEEEGTVSLSLVMTGNTQEPFDVEINTVDNTAIAPQDYSELYDFIEFDGFDGETHTVTIPIIDDDIAEATESFEVHFYTTSSIIPINNDIALVSIEDNDGSDQCELVELSASDGAPNELFGKGLKLSFDQTTLAVSSYFDNQNGDESGSVFIFERQADGNWMEVQKLVSSDIEAEDLFGYSLSFSGNELFIGAYGENLNSGAVYVFEKDTDGLWKEKQKLVASDTNFSDHFGYAIGSSNNFLIIGAPNNDDTATNTGSVYVFEKINGIWSEKQKLVASDPAAYDGFGISLGIYDKSIIIGSWYDDDQGDNSGAAYIFKENIDGIWQENQKLLPNDGATNDFFGRKVAISDGTVVVSSTDNFQSSNWDGAAYIFDETANGTWIQTSKLVPNDIMIGDRFAESIDIDDGLIVIGSPRDDDGVTSSGSVYLFSRTTEGEWNEIQKINNCNPNESESFGDTVTILDSTIAIGTYLFGNIGTAYVIDTLSQIDPLTINNWEATMVTCSGAQDGFIRIHAAGGTQPYTYELQDNIGNTVGTPQSINEFANLDSGNYWVAVKDANGETESVQIEIIEPAPLQFDTVVTNVTCEESDNGSVEIANLIGGSGSYLFGLNDAEVTSAQSSHIFTDLAVGDYTVYVFDTNGCVAFIEFTISVEIDSTDFDQDGISDACDNDVDGDGVLNEVDQCPETPKGVNVDSNGCEVFALPIDNFTIQIVGENCAVSDNGSISVNTIENLLYTGILTFDGQVVESQNFTTRADFRDLESGIYQLCITVNDHPSYEKCFSLTITEPEALEVNGLLDESGTLVTLRMRGGSSYTVTHNTSTFNTSESELTLELDGMVNAISVKTDLDCQGSYEETFLLEKSIQVYPNPVVGQEIHIVLRVSNTENSIVGLYTLAGSQLLLEYYDAEQNEIDLQLPNLPRGTYLLMIAQGNKVSSEKIIIK